MVLLRGGERRAKAQMLHERVEIAIAVPVIAGGLYGDAVVGDLDFVELGEEADCIIGAPFAAGALQYLHQHQVADREWVATIKALRQRAGLYS
ncbi:hypothetical protein WR25_12867 [Diploscapter pachys]|uniref:Uncharacterized protein n=1 Tax=Diploscapter pachys TaxID=2018661 RepID=A0A2A2K963_9BILA|nr:hypothetical protein WR25_12867 [Diploscapter pachys]